jgi:hypothetical protein
VLRWVEMADAFSLTFVRGQLRSAPVLLAVVAFGLFALVLWYLLIPYSHIRC